MQQNTTRKTKTKQHEQFKLGVISSFSDYQADLQIHGNWRVANVITNMVKSLIR